MVKRRTVASQDLGLGLALLLTRYLLDTEELHFGLWSDDLPVTLANFPAAQERYTKFVESHLPAGIKDVLEVGCGAGGMALRLLDRGLAVEVVAPPSLLLERAKERISDRAEVHEICFEDYAGDRQFDLVLFCESFQYVDIQQSLHRAAQVLRPGGHIMICDFFRRPGKHHSPIGGGTRFHLFDAEVERAGLARIKDIDITAETAPTIDLIDDFLRRVGKPGYELGLDYATRTRPWLTKLLTRRFRKKIAKLEYKHFSGRRTGHAFTEYKSYRLFLLQKAAG